ncbi:MAG: TrkH family potassium uptake protein [Chloroflexota bacterium]
MRIRFILHYLGLLLIGLALFMLLPLGFSIYYREPDITALIISFLITATVGLVMRLSSHKPDTSLSRREALLLVAGTWVLSSIFGALPYMFSGVLPSAADAFFESMSGFTTTGASVLTHIADQPRGILLWRDLTQWLGGMGIIALFVAVLPMIGIGAAHLIESELPGPKGERITARVRDTARILWLLYVGLTVIEITALTMTGMTFFDALLNTFGTMPTGGFSPHNLSIGGYNSLPAEIVIIIFMILAGTNFQLFYYILWKRDFRVVVANRELRAYLGIMLVASLLIALDLFRGLGYSLANAFRYASFQVVSIQTTTGFATADFSAWPPFSQAILLVLMGIGASACSTGGAIKVIRVLVLIKFACRQILVVLNPNAVRPIKLAGKVLSEQFITEIVALSVLYASVLVLGFVVMSAFGLDPLSALSSVAASLGNVGPGLGMVGPMANYAFIHPVGKVFLAFCMLIGRLEFWTVLTLFVPSFWRT